MTTTLYTYTRAIRVLIMLMAISGVSEMAMAQPAPRFEAGGQIAVAASSEFDETDAGIGGRLAWFPLGLVGVEGEINVFPRDVPADFGSTAFSRTRIEGLFGATVGPVIGRVRPFAKVRPGFLRFNDAGPIACIRIFPPPLACTLAEGRTVMALDLGGGLEFFPSPETFLRIDAGDRILRYPTPAFDADRNARMDSFVSHDFRVAIGGGLRF